MSNPGKEPVNKKYNNPQACRQAMLDRKLKVVQDIKSKIGCRRCGFTDYRALDFQHKDPKTVIRTKGGQRRALAGLSYQILLEEVSKCEVICANCHRIEHYRQKRK